MIAKPEAAIPLAALGVPERVDPTPVDLPLAYLPRIPDSPSYREVLERAVGWGRR